MSASQFHTETLCGIGLHFAGFLFGWSVVDGG